MNMHTIEIDNATVTFALPKHTEDLVSFLRGVFPKEARFSVEQTGLFISTDFFSGRFSAHGYIVTHNGKSLIMGMSLEENVCSTNKHGALHGAVTIAKALREYFDVPSEKE